MRDRRGEPGRAPCGFESPGYPQVEPDAVDASTWYGDLDGDGFGDVSLGVIACEGPAGCVRDATDCDDAHDAAYPGATEVCDSLDNDRDGEHDEASAVDAPTWYADGDGDGYGGAVTAVSCDAPLGYAAGGGDCDDADPGASPGTSEICDEVDNDCDGSVDDAAVDASPWYLDSDRDGTIVTTPTWTWTSTSTHTPPKCRTTASTPTATAWISARTSTTTVGPMS